MRPPPASTPYTAFDASPGGVIPAYNAQAQTFVLFTRQRRLGFDLAEGTVTDQDGNVKTVSTTFRGGILYVPLVYCASFFGLKVALLTSENGYPILRFTTGSEVYDDSLFVEKAESLIRYRIEQMSMPEPDRNTPGSQPDTPQLLVLSENASQALVTLRAANASIELLRETTKLP